MRNTKRRSVFIIVSVLVAVSIVVLLINYEQGGAGGGFGSAGRVATIGVILPLTGDSNIAGAALENAIELARHEVNQSERLRDWTIEFEYADGKCTGAGGREAAQTLIQKGVKIIIGGFCSGETLGAAPVTQEADTLLITPASSNPSISDLGYGVFRNSVSDRESGRALAEEIHSQGFTNVGVLHENTEYANALVDRFVSTLSGLGSQIATLERFELDARDVSAEVVALRNVSLDAVLVITQSSATMRRVFQTLDQEEIDYPIFANEFADSNDVKSLGELVAGTKYAVPYLNERRPETIAFFEKYNKEYPAHAGIPRFYLATAYDTVYILADAIASPPISVETVIENLDALRGFSGAAHGALYFNAQGDANYEFTIREL